MTKKRRTRSQASRAYVRKLENPYASVQLEEDTQKSPDAAMSMQNREIYRRSENPHAFHYYADSPEPGTQPSVSERSARSRSTKCFLSKAAFRSRCQAIFRPYIPIMERGQLRPHHRDFIARNESQPGDVRFALIEKLQRYDCVFRRR